MNTFTLSISVFTYRIINSIDRAISSVSRVTATAFKYMQCARQQQANRIILQNLSDRELKDIGINRADIERVIKQPCI